MYMQDRDKHFERAENLLTKIGNITELLDSNQTDWAKNYWGHTRYVLQRKLNQHLDEPKQPWIQVVKLNY